MTRFILFFLLSAAAFLRAQVSISVRTEGGRRDYATGENIVVDVLLKVNGDEMHQQTPLRLFPTNKFEVVGSGSEQNLVLDEKTGTYINETHYQTILRVKRPGSYKIGSASVQVNDRLYYTEPFELNVTGRAEPLADHNDRGPVSLRLTVDKPNPYQSEATIARITAYSRNVEDLQRVHHLSFPTSSSYEILETQFRRNEVGQADGGHFQVLAVITIIPEKAGKLTIKPVHAVLGRRSKIQSNPLEIKVKPVPGIAAAQRLPVGNYKVSLNRMNEEEVREDTTFKIQVGLSGIGNLSSKDLPQLKGNSGFTTFPPIIKKQKPDASGTQGLIAEYIIRPSQKGPLTLETLPFSYFDPTTGKHKVAPSEKLTLEVGAPASTFSETLGLEEVGRVTRNLLSNNKKEESRTTQGKANHQKKSHHSGTVWLWLLAIAASSIGIGYLIRRRRRGKSIARENLLQQEDSKENSNKNLAFRLTQILANIYSSIREEDFSQVFQGYSKMDLMVRKMAREKTGDSFEIFVEKQYGSSLLEKYRRLIQQIEMERQAPEHNQEELVALTEYAGKIYLIFS